MATPKERSAGERGLYFLACFMAAPLLGVGLGLLTGARDLPLILSGIALPAVLMLGYGIWHGQRIIRTIRMRLGGARRVTDDPVAEHAAGSFQVAGWVVAATWLIGYALAGRAWHGAGLAILSILFAAFLGRAAREGRLPAPEFE